MHKSPDCLSYGARHSFLKFLSRIPSARDASGSVAQAIRGTSISYFRAAKIAGRLSGEVPFLAGRVLSIRSSIGAENSSGLNSTRGEAILDSVRGSYAAELGISPERSAGIAPGSYTIRAVLKEWSWIPWHWRGRVVSNPIKLAIRAAGSLSDEQLCERLAESAQFYLMARDYQAAADVARQLVKRKPSNSDARVALGDALNGLRKDQEALRSYEMALQLISTQPPSREPPEYLWGRIVQVSQRIHRKSPI